MPEGPTPEIAWCVHQDSSLVCPALGAHKGHPPACSSRDLQRQGRRLQVSQGLRATLSLELAALPDLPSPDSWCPSHNTDSEGHVLLHEGMKLHSPIPTAEASVATVSRRSSMGSSDPGAALPKFLWSRNPPARPVEGRLRPTSPGPCEEGKAGAKAQSK